VGQTALCIASTGGYEDILKLLLYAGAQIYRMGFSGIPLQNTFFEGHENVTRLLLEEEAHVNAKGKWVLRCSALHFMAILLEVVELLLDKGAFVNAERTILGTLLKCAMSEWQ